LTKSNYYEKDTLQEEFALSLSAVSKSFGGLVAVNNVSFNVNQGRIFGVMGPNGAGKTTLINLISGLLKPENGSISVLGQDITELPAYEIASQFVARTFQNIRLIKGLTVLENIQAGQYLYKQDLFLDSLFHSPRFRKQKSQMENDAIRLMKMVNLDVHPEAIADTLSYGDQRRVEIARALSLHPKILLLDEPAAGMNTFEVNQLGSLFQALRAEGLTLIIIEHNMQLILNYCDEAIVMNFGELIATGTPKECVLKPIVREAYFGRKADVKRIESLFSIRGD
jgi:branched-chain amino acid transport system ATP-binding protein